ncbi:MAG: sialidase, partial [Euryarchaeota archaeon]
GTPGWFVVGTNHALYWSTGDSWTNLGGYVSSSPGATSPSSGVIDVGVRGSNGAVYEKIYTGG